MKIRHIVGAAAAVAVLAVTGAGWTAHADPAGANCESNLIGALYCDGPIRADGTWVRCLDVGSQAITGQWGQVSSWTLPVHRCFTYNPANPPGLPLGQPAGHIGDGL